MDEETIDLAGHFGERELPRASFAVGRSGCPSSGYLPPEARTKIIPAEKENVGGEIVDLGSGQPASLASGDAA